MQIDFEKIMILVLVGVSLVQFLTTRKMITSDDVKEILDKLKPEVEKTENKMDDVLVDIAEKLAELIDKRNSTV